MPRKQQRVVLKCAGESTRLPPDARARVCNECVRKGAKPGGGLVTIPLSWIVIGALLAIVICWLIYAAFQSPQPHIALSMVLFGYLIPVGTLAARQWLYRMYYRQPVVIGT